MMNVLGNFDDTPKDAETWAARLREMGVMPSGP